MPADPPALPERALQERFLAATGPGGQNVNKVETACQLTVDVTLLDLAPAVFARLRTRAGRLLTQDGRLIITANRFRTREANRADARVRAAALIAEARVPPQRRVASKPTRASKLRRLDAKRGRSAIKAGRGKPVHD